MKYYAYWIVTWLTINRGKIKCCKPTRKVIKHLLQICVCWLIKSTWIKKILYKSYQKAHIKVLATNLSVMLFLSRGLATYLILFVLISTSISMLWMLSEAMLSYIKAWSWFLYCSVGINLWNIMPPSICERMIHIYILTMKTNSTYDGLDFMPWYEYIFNIYYTEEDGK